MKKIGIVEDMEHCYVCGKPYPEMHHCIHGTANRKLSEKFGLKIPLCHTHHRTGIDAPHRSAMADLHYKQMAQRYFEEHHGNREMFRQIFGKSWL